MTNILEDFATAIDSRTSLFDVKIDSEMNGMLTLSGRVLDAAQLDELPRLFPTHKLDIAAIRVLNAETHERVHVTTNLTGLYECPTFGMPLSSELYYGTELEVLDERGNWVFTRQVDGYLGWAYRRYLGEGPAPAATHLVLAPVIELRAEPSVESPVLTRVVSGTGVIVNGWGNRSSTDGATNKRLGITDEGRGWVQVQANRSGWLPASSLRAITDIPEGLEEKRNLIVADSTRMIGIPYLWGGTSGNGIDCSGFARLLHRWVGVDIPRDADMQHAAATPVEPPYQIGDLFFFAEDDSRRNISHVGLSLGGWRMIHSSRTNNGVYIDDLQERKSLMDIFIGAGRFLRQ